MAVIGVTDDILEFIHGFYLLGEIVSPQSPTLNLIFQRFSVEKPPAATLIEIILSRTTASSLAFASQQLLTPVLAAVCCVS